ncbi:MAG: RNA polymerase sigma-54 factor, partial [Firmicutes bacterium]|nr:RNA polymerase sigma-54 factor [Bacillota bacterium]
MRMGYGLNVIQTQKLIMTPELRQAITILQLSALELESYVEQQLEENPLLEVRDEEIERSVTGDKIAAEDKPEDNGYDIDWQDYFQDSSDLGLPRSEIQADPNWYGYEHFASRTPT